MGQLRDLHDRTAELLVLIQAAAGGSAALRIYDSPPNALPEMPCIFELTPDEDYENMDTLMAQSTVTATLRVCVAMGQPQTDLLDLCDAVIAASDGWLRDEHPSPIDQARRIAMRGSTPVFNEIPTRGADFSLRIELEFRQTANLP